MTVPVKVGPDGCAAFSVYSFNSEHGWYAVQFQMNINAGPSADYVAQSAGWVGISNVGDGSGRFYRHFNNSIGACLTGIPEGSFVRAHIYQLDGNDSTSCYMSVRTNPPKESNP